MAGAAIGLAAAGRAVRAAFAGDLLSRRVPGLRSAFRDGRVLRRHCDAGAHEHGRHPDNDWYSAADLVVQTGRRPRLGNAQAAARCRPCRRRGMKKWTALGRAVAVGAIVLCSAAARGEPADICAVPSYLLFGDSLLTRVNAAVKKD